MVARRLNFHATRGGVGIDGQRQHLRRIPSCALWYRRALSNPVPRITGRPMPRENEMQLQGIIGCTVHHEEQSELFTGGCSIFCSLKKKIGEEAKAEGKVEAEAEADVED